MGDGPMMLALAKRVQVVRESPGMITIISDYGDLVKESIVASHCCSMVVLHDGCLPVVPSHLVVDVYMLSYHKRIGLYDLFLDDQWRQRWWWLCHCVCLVSTFPHPFNLLYHSGFLGPCSLKLLKDSCFPEA